MLLKNSPEFIEQKRTFDYKGGIMYSANCRDYLEVPEYAVIGKIEISECQPPYMCYNEGDEYVGIVAKKYEQSDKKSDLFDRHVRIVSYYAVHKTSDSIGLSPNHLRIMYSSTDGSFHAVNCNDYGADVYYTINAEQNRITIYTKHFTVYVIKTIKESELAIIHAYPGPKKK
jgi:hypothetical protein